MTETETAKETETVSETHKETDKLHLVGDFDKIEH